MGSFDFQNRTRIGTMNRAIGAPSTVSASRYPIAAPSRDGARRSRFTRSFDKSRIAHWRHERASVCVGATASWTAVGEGLGAHTAFRFGSVLVAGASFQSGVSPVPRQPPHSKTLRASARFMEWVSVDSVSWAMIEQHKVKQRRRGACASVSLKSTRGYCL